MFCLYLSLGTISILLILSTNVQYWLFKETIGDHVEDPTKQHEKLME